MKHKPYFQSRRRFLASLAGVLSYACASGGTKAGRRPRILLRSSWQTVNIGLGDWLFNFDKAEDRDQMPDTAVQMALQRDASLAKAAEALKVARTHQRESMEQLGAFV